MVKLMVILTHRFFHPLNQLNTLVSPLSGGWVIPITNRCRDVFKYRYRRRYYKYRKILPNTDKHTEQSVFPTSVSLFSRHFTATIINIPQSTAYAVHANKNSWSVIVVYTNFAIKKWYVGVNIFPTKIHAQTIEQNRRCWPFGNPGMIY